MELVGRRPGTHHGGLDQQSQRSQEEPRYGDLRCPLASRSTPGAKASAARVAQKCREASSSSSCKPLFPPQFQRPQSKQFQAMPREDAYAMRQRTKERVREQGTSDSLASLDEKAPSTPIMQSSRILVHSRPTSRADIGGEKPGSAHETLLTKAINSMGAEQGAQCQVQQVKSAPRATGPPPSQDSMCESSLDADAWPFAASSETSFMESTQLLPDALMQKFERHGPQLRGSVGMMATSEARAATAPSSSEKAKLPQMWRACLSEVAQQEEPFSRAQEQMERAESSPMSRAATPVTLTCTLGGDFGLRSLESTGAPSTTDLDVTLASNNLLKRSLAPGTPTQPLGRPATQPLADGSSCTYAKSVYLPQLMMQTSMDASPSWSSATVTPRPRGASLEEVMHDRDRQCAWVQNPWALEGVPAAPRITSCNKTWTIRPFGSAHYGAGHAPPIGKKTSDSKLGGSHTRRHAIQFAAKTFSSVHRVRDTSLQKSQSSPRDQLRNASIWW